MLQKIFKLVQFDRYLLERRMDLFIVKTEKRHLSIFIAKISLLSDAWGWENLFGWQDFCLVLINDKLLGVCWVKRVKVCWKVFGLLRLDIELTTALVQHTRCVIPAWTKRANRSTDWWFSCWATSWCWWTTCCFWAARRQWNERWFRATWFWTARKFTARFTIYNFKLLTGHFFFYSFFCFFLSKLLICFTSNFF